jgi:hypothetical protein
LVSIHADMADADKAAVGGGFRGMGSKGFVKTATGGLGVWYTSPP